MFQAVGQGRIPNPSPSLSECSGLLFLYTKEDMPYSSVAV